MVPQMKSSAFFLTVLLYICTVHAQTLHVSCTGSIDHARVQPDSVRIVCAELGIDSTVGGSSFTLPTPTNVSEHGVEEGVPMNVDIYDIRGRYIESTIKATNTNS